MRNKTFAAYILIFCFLCLPSSFPVQEGNTEQDSEKEAKSLIRKDLLQIKREDPKLPGRNIFVPQSRRMSEELVQAFETSPGLREEALSGVKDSSFSFNLRYIGYIDSGHKMVALVIFEGEAIAVEKGEKISSQYAVEEITTESIKIIGPSGEKKKIPLEGES